MELHVITKYSDDFRAISTRWAMFASLYEKGQSTNVT